MSILCIFGVVIQVSSAPVLLLSCLFSAFSEWLYKWAVLLCYCYHVHSVHFLIGYTSEQCSSAIVIMSILCIFWVVIQVSSAPVLLLSCPFCAFSEWLYKWAVLVLLLSCPFCAFSEWLYKWAMLRCYCYHVNSVHSRSSYTGEQCSGAIVIMSIQCIFWVVIQVSSAPVLLLSRPCSASLYTTPSSFIKNHYFCREYQ
jgi:hypothetical protein